MFVKGSTVTNLTAGPNVDWTITGNQAAPYVPSGSSINNLNVTTALYLNGVNVTTLFSNTSLAVNSISHNYLNWVDTSSATWGYSSGDLQLEVNPVYLWRQTYADVQATNYLTRATNDAARTLTFDLSNTGTPTSSNFYSGTKAWTQVTTNMIPGLPAVLNQFATNLSYLNTNIVAGGGGNVYTSSNNVLTASNVITGSLHLPDVYANDTSVRLGFQARQRDTPPSGWSAAVDAASDAYSVSIGYAAQTWRKGTVVGSGGNASYYGTAIGYNAEAGNNATSIGQLTHADDFCASVGGFAYGNNSVVVGVGYVTGSSSITVGTGQLTGNNSILIGAGNWTEDNAIQLGDTSQTVIVPAGLSLGGVVRTNWPSGSGSGTNIYNNGSTVKGNAVTNFLDGSNVSWLISGSQASPYIPVGATVSNPRLYGPGMSMTSLTSDTSSSTLLPLVLDGTTNNYVKTTTPAYMLTLIDGAHSGHGHTTLTNLTVNGDLSVTTNLFVGGSNILALINAGSSVTLGASKLYGRGSLGGSGAAQPIGLASPMAMDSTGTNLTIAAGNYGDIVVSNGGWTVTPNAITLAKMANVSDQRLLGRAAGSSGNVQSLTTTDGIWLTNGVVTLKDGNVSLSKLTNNSTASSLLGRGALSGTGSPEKITLGSGLSMSGTVLNATGAGLRSVVVQTADFTVANTNDVVLCNFNTVAGTVTLPTDGSISDGRVVTLVKIGSENVVTSDSFISSPSPYTLLNAGSSITVVFSAAQNRWYVIAVYSGS